MSYDSWKAREPDLSRCYEVGVFDTRAEAEQQTDEYYSDKHVEFTTRGLSIMKTYLVSDKLRSPKLMSLNEKRAICAFLNGWLALTSRPHLRSCSSCFCVRGR